jgi:hypothetical protein
VRRVAAIVFMLVTVQVSGVGVAVETACIEHCEDDGPDGQCAPTCRDCACCAQPRIVPPLLTGGAVSAAPTMIPQWPVEPTPDCPYPGEILRVPKLLFHGSTTPIHGTVA